MRQSGVNAIGSRRFRRVATTFFAAAVSAASWCSATAGGETVNGGAADPVPTILGELPASFEGELPCADCPGIYYHLDLFEDRVFFLRTTYDGRGAGAVNDTIGSWVVVGDDNRLALFGGTETPIFFRVVDETTLRKLDVEGRKIESSLNYQLRRLDQADPVEPRLMLRGMYRYMADAALFEECLSGRRFQVAQEADNLALERAYLAAQPEPGEPILVSLKGRITERPAVEGTATVLTLVPERFFAVWPGETCGARMTVAELENTYWKLTRLGGQPVLPSELQRELYLVLRSGDHRVTGFGGCNQVSGTYSVDGSAIEFSEMAGTMMACADAAETERTFLAALGSARSWRVIGEHLDLFDGAGDLAARFEAKNLN
jgi:copper homeostasis protein (lipoprotein)